jgi:uncharacterized protein (DUF1697 family)
MTIHAALLRAVNLGPHNKIAMRDLRELGASLGLQDTRTLLQSGNLVFRSGESPVRLERLLEQAAESRLGLRTAFFVRTARELDSIVAGNPFPAEAARDPAHLLVVFLKAVPKAGAVASLQAAIRGREVVRARGRQAWIVYPDGIGRSRVTSALIEQKLGCAGTGRNWNTVLKLRALAQT